VVSEPSPAPMVGRVAFARMAHRRRLKRRATANGATPAMFNEGPPIGGVAPHPKNKVEEEETPPGEKENGDYAVPARTTKRGARGV